MFSRTSLQSARAASNKRSPLLLQRGLSCRSSAFSSFSSSSSSSSSSSKLVGQVKEPYLDLRNVKVGQQINIPYDVTIGSGLREQWQSTFYQHDRLYTSRRFAQSLNLRDTVLPFSLMLFNAVSMSHLDPGREVLDLGLDNAHYVRPAYEDDTFHKTFTVKALRPTKDGDDTVIRFQCELFNQKQNLVFSVDKAMMFRGVSPSLQRPPQNSAASSNKSLQSQSHLYSHIVHNAAELPQSSNLARLDVGELILHNLCRPVGHTANRSLSTSFRLTHPLLMNCQRYADDELVVSGGLVLSAAMAAASKCFYEVLTESLISCSFLNKVHPGDLVGSMSYVSSIKPVAGGSLEEVTVRTIGVKNCDITVDLKGVELPLELFTGKVRRNIVEELVAKECPQLAGKLVVSADRVLVRQSPFTQAGFMPLL